MTVSPLVLSCLNEHNRWLETEKRLVVTAAGRDTHRLCVPTA